MLSLNSAWSYNKNKKLAILRSGLGIHIRLGSQQIPVIKDKKKSDLKLKNASHTDGQQGRPYKADSGSFICKSPPQARDCPMKEKLAGCRGQEGRTP